MKKILLTILFVTISSYLFACSCFSPRLLDRFANSDFVATLTVLSVDSETDDDYLNLEIEIIELYKGNETNLLKIRKPKGSGCSMYTPEKTKWLIFAKKDENENLVFGYCSGPKQLDKTFDKKRYPNAEFNYYRRLERKLELLKALKKENIIPINEYNLHITLKHESIEKISGTKVKKSSQKVFCELTVNKDLSIKNVIILKEFINENLSQDLIKYIKNNFKIVRLGKLDEIPKETKMILRLIFQTSQNDKTSIIMLNTW